MEVTAATLRALDTLHGLTRTDAEREAALPAARQMVEMLGALDAVPLDAAAEPTTQFRVV